MTRPGIVVFALWAAAALGAPVHRPALADTELPRDPSLPVVDTRLTVTFGDDDVRGHPPPLSADGKLPIFGDYPGFGDRPGYQLFYDNLNTRYSGRETLTNLAIYRKLPGFWPRLTTEAALVVRLQIDHNQEHQVTLADTGSYIRLHWALGSRPSDGLSLVAFPFDSDRFRLGYLYRLSVGSNTEYPRHGWIGAPGAKLQLDVAGVHAFVGFKAIPSLTVQPDVLATDAVPYETQYSAIGGVGWDLLHDQLRLELGAAYLGQGDNPIKDVAGVAYYTAGVAGRAVFHRALPIEDSIDLTLYTNDPNRPFRAFAPVQYRPGTIGFLISVEGMALWQHLADPDTYGHVKFQRGLAFALQARLQLGYWRVELTGMYRDLAFLLHTAPGFVPFTAFPADAQVRPELLAALSTDYCFPRQRLTLGVSAGLLAPAWLSVVVIASQVGSSVPPTLIGRHTIIIRDDGSTTILPENETTVRPLLHTRLQARLDLSQMLYALAWVQYRYDPNRSWLQVDPADLTRTRVVDPGHQLGVGVSAAVRF